MIRDFSTHATPALRARAEAWAALGDDTPEVPPARPAATVMLVRDAPDGGDPGLEVFMLLRVGTMAFAPNTMVFPGGGVDRRDGVDVPWAGPPVTAWSARLGADDELTRMILVAAVREVFEECGVLLASTTEDGRLVDTDNDYWRSVRARLVAQEISLAELLNEDGLVLRTDLLRAHAQWMTPAIETRQFDARIFVALMPRGAVADFATSEASHGGWFRPQEVLDAKAAGSALLMPPTQVSLEDAASASSAADFFAREPVIRLIHPQLTRDDTGELVLRAELPGR